MSGSSDEAVREALIGLIDRYERPLYNFLVVMVQDRDAARDCTQDVFLRALEHLAAGRRLTPAWLYRVARHRAIDEARRRKRIQPDLDACMRTAEPVPDERSGPVLRALGYLSPNDRELLYLFEIDRFDAGEIGAMLGISRNAVHVRLFRARERFRKVYRPTGEPPCHAMPPYE